MLTADGIVERYSMSADDEANTTMASSSPLSADGSLLMRSVDLTDDGKYVCSISNNLGETETTVNFQVLGKNLNFLYFMKAVDHTVRIPSENDIVTVRCRVPSTNQLGHKISHPRRCLQVYALKT